MFISCLHCRELVAIDRESGLAPEMCPRCGGVLRETSATEASTADTQVTGERSFISFLQSGATATVALAETTTATGREAIEKEAAADPASLEGPSGGSSEMEMDAATIHETTPDIGTEENGTHQADPDAAPLLAASASASASASATQALPAMPSFTRQLARPGPHPRTAGWQWAMLIVLPLMLGLQVLLADRAHLAADATWRPLVARLCGVLGCSIPPWHQPGAFSMLSRDVSPIAGSAGGLSVRATFRNDARWAQAWPVLLLSLSDADGRVLGSRAFTPREYLGAAATQAQLAPGQSAQIALQLHEPNPDVVAFTFDFR